MNVMFYFTTNLFKRFCCCRRFRFLGRHTTKPFGIRMFGITSDPFTHINTDTFRWLHCRQRLGGFILKLIFYIMKLYIYIRILYTIIKIYYKNREKATIN